VVATNPIPGSRPGRAPLRHSVFGSALGGRLAWAAASAAIIGVSAGAGAHFLFGPQSPPRAASALPELHGQASWASGVRPAPLFVLRDVFGATTSFSSLLGHGALLAFMDSRCAPRCPFLGQAISDAEEMLPAASRPAVVVVSIDPAADSATSVRSALRRWRVPPGWHWLSGTVAQLTRVWRAYGVPAARAQGQATALYLIDARGDERAGYLPPILPNFLALDIHRIELDATRRPAG